MTSPAGHRARRYGRAALIVALALGSLAIPTVREGQGTPLLVAIFAIFLAAWQGGRGPGLAVTGFFVVVTWADNWPAWRILRLALFAGFGVAISQLMEVLHAARRRAEDESRSRGESEARSRLLFEANPRPMWVFDVETLRFLDVNRMAIAQYGYSRDEFLAMGIGEIRPREDLERLRRHVEALRGSDNHEGALWTHRRKDGTVFDVRINSATLVFDGRPARLVLAEDVTKQLQAEGRVRASERQLRAVFDGTTDALVVADDRGRIVQANPAASVLFGLPEGELVGRKAGGLGEEGGSPWRATPGPDPGPARGEFRLVRGDGTVRETEFHAIPGLLPDRNLAILRDVTDRRVAEAALHASEARFRRLADSGVLGVVVADLGGVVHEANDSFLRLVGRDRDDLRAGRVRWDGPPEYAPADARAVEDLEATGACPPFEKELARPDGSRVPVVIGAAREDGSGRVVAFVLDISDRKRIEADLVKAREAAEEAGRAKDRFLAVLSHELRTPLTPVLLAVGSMADDPGTPEATRSTLEMIRRNVGLEARLIDDLLDMTRLGRGRLIVEPRPVDAHEAVRRAEEVCRADFESAGVRLEVGLEAAASVVEADPLRLQQAVWNLLKNAAKFTPRGGSVVARSRNEPGPGTTVGGPSWVLDVVDTGPGIEPSALARIFEAFEQGDSSPSRRAEGLGLGLAIGRAVAEAHGGRLAAASPGLGRGSTFTLELPAARPPGPSTRPEPSTPAAGRPTRLRILLVEDNKDTRRFLDLFLGQRGHEVRAAGSLAEARELAEGPGEFDLILSDIELPDGTGLELMREIEGRVPGVAMSGYGSEEDVRMSKSAGFAEHLVKPVDVRRLEEAIAAASDPGRSPGSPRRLAPTGAARPSGPGREA